MEPNTQLLVVDPQQLSALITQAVEAALQQQVKEQFATRNMLTVAEAAAYTGRKVSFIRHLRQTGQLPIKKEGKTVLIAKKELEPYRL